MGVATSVVVYCALPADRVHEVDFQRRQNLRDRRKVITRFRARILAPAALTRNRYMLQ